MSGEGSKVRLVSARKWSAVTAGVAVGLGLAGVANAQQAIWTGPEKIWLAQASTEGGEGGEGGGAVAPVSEGLAVLVALAKLDAHLLTAFDLAAAGQAEDAEKQAEVSVDEIYPSIEGALAAAKAPGFEAELVAVEKAFEPGVAADVAKAAYTEFQAAQEAARVVLAPSAKDELAAVLALVRESAEDFEVGVKDGAVVELGEYQDARAYLLAARSILTRLSGAADAAVAGAAEKSAAAVDEVIAALPEVVPAGAVKADAGLILGAAARVELAAYQVK